MDEEIDDTLRRILVAVHNKENIILHGPGGTGKCLDPFTQVLMYNGSIKYAKDVLPGDILMGDDSTPRNVLSICCGEDDMFQVETSKGDTFTVNFPHVLTLKCSHNIIDIPLQDYLYKSDVWKSQHRTFKVGVEFPIRRFSLPINPYYLGLWLGQRSISVFTDKEIIEWLSQYKQSLIQQNNVTDGGFCLKSVLEDLGVFKKKHIPEIYLFSDRKNRLAILAGLIDSNGRLTCNSYEIIQKDWRLTKDMVFLVRSLGYACYSYLCEKTYTDGSQNPVFGMYHRIEIYGEGLDEIPILLSRKKAIHHKQTIKDALNLDMKITSIGRGAYSGFTLDGNGRFVLGNFIVTHNTYTLRNIAGILSQQGKMVCCTATTGAAALNLSNSEMKITATTLHSWAGVGLAREDAKKLFSKVLRNSKAKKRWLYTDILIIDEVSMLGASLVDKLDFIGRNIRNEQKQSFGGLQLIFSGDFLQLPPVKEEWAFESDAWKKIQFTPFIFDQPKRYDDDDYFHMLLRIRNGKCIVDDAKKLRARVKAYKKLQQILGETDSINVIKPTIIYSKRIDVDDHNEQELGKLPGGIIEYVAEDTFTAHNSSANVDHYTRILDDVIPKVISLKIGAQVMLKINLDVEKGLVNGSRGVVLNLDQEWVYVRFINGVKTVIPKNTWTADDNDGEVIRSQIPFILAWSLTIHKSQGSTLDYAICDIGSSIFAPGQAYVALSRVRNLKGLFIREFYSPSIKADITALQYAEELSMKETKAPSNNKDSLAEKLELKIIDMKE